jgi:hypothetical protein
MTNNVEPRRPIPPAPIHPLAALVTLILDNVFGVVELVNPLAILLTSLLVTLVGTLCATLIQRYLPQEDWGKAAAKGLAMGIVAGVPFSVSGTALGVPLLAWAGLHEWVKLPPRQDPNDPNVIDGEYKES